MHHKNKLLKDLTAGVKKNKWKLITLLGLLTISLIPIAFLLKPGFPVTDDGTWLVIRFSAFFETLRSGQMPVRYIYRLDDGMGYPVSNFLYPLYLYLATPLHIFGLSFLNSIKALLILNIFLSSIFTFLWLNRKFDNISSFLGSVTLVLSPYFLFDLYKRGSIGELLTFSIVPFILWQIERKSFILLSIGFFLLILSHNTLGLLFLILIQFYSSINKFDLKLQTKALVLGLGLSAFFWIPALLGLSDTIFLKTKVSDFYNYLFKPGNYYLIGLSTLIIIISAIFIYFKSRRNTKNLFFISSIIISVFIIFLQFPQSKIIWEIFPFRNFIQFPFRLLSILVILLVFQSAYVSSRLKKYKGIYVFTLVLILILQSFLFLKNIEFQKYEDGFYFTNQSSTTVSNEYRNKWLINPDSSREKIQINQGKGEILRKSIMPEGINLLADFQTDGEIQINMAYFPQWKVIIDGKEVAIDYKKNGLINFKINEGRHEINAIYTQSLVHKISNLISIISFTVLIYFSLKILKALFLRYNLK